MKIKFTISSHINSYEKTYPVLLESLLKSGVPNEDIYFFIGGFNEYSKIDNQDGINVYGVNHNSIDFTGLISVLDLKLTADYWFLLHDTCYVGDRFYKNVISYDYKPDAFTVSLVKESATMNIGAYRMDFLNHIYGNLMSLKNQDYSQQGIINVKQMAYRTEGMFFDKKYCYNPNPHINEGLPNGIDFYKTGVLRLLEHYEDLDLHKLKANFCGWDAPVELRV